MPIPAHKAIGNNGHTDDHNSITTELTSHKSKLDNTPAVNVKDYGAVGDGVADDTDAIQDAYTAAATVDGAVVLNGTHLISNTIVVPSNTRMFGPGVILITGIDETITSTLPSPGTACYNAFLLDDNVDNVQFENVTFRGENDPYSESPLCWAGVIATDSGHSATVTNIAVRNCRFENIHGFGLQHHGSGGPFDVTDNTFVEVSNAINVSADYSTIRGNLLTTGVGIECAATHALIEGNNITGGQISLGGRSVGAYGFGTICRGNTISGGATSGIIVADGFADGVVSQNVIRGCGTTGILVTGPTQKVYRVVISDNVIVCCGLDGGAAGSRRGIGISSSSEDITVKGNIIIDDGSLAGYTTAYGITLSTGTRITVTGNRTFGMASRAFEVNATTAVAATGNSWDASGTFFFGGATFTAPTTNAGLTAYTQTYATADRTHANPTAATLTVTDGAGTNDNTIGAITGDASVIAAVQEMAAQINKLVADQLDTKQLVNAVIDDLQTLGLLT